MNLFGSDNWFYIILIGLVVGILARLLKPGRDRMGIILTIVLGFNFFGDGVRDWLDPKSRRR